MICSLILRPVAVNLLRWIVRTMGASSIVKLLSALTSFLHLHSIASVDTRGVRGASNSLLTLVLVRSSQLIDLDERSQRLLDTVDSLDVQTEVEHRVECVGRVLADSADDATSQTTSEDLVYECCILESLGGFPMGIMRCQSTYVAREEEGTNGGLPNSSATCILSIQNRKNSCASSCRPTLRCFAMPERNGRTSVQLRVGVGRRTHF